MSWISRVPRSRKNHLGHNDVCDLTNDERVELHLSGRCLECESKLPVHKKNCRKRRSEVIKRLAGKLDEITGVRWYEHGKD